MSSTERVSDTAPSPIMQMATGFWVSKTIILLSIYYPGQWYISLFRILDVAIGGAIAVALVYLKGLKLSRIRS
jgi:hypothetical protein